MTTAAASTLDRFRRRRSRGSAGDALAALEQIDPSPLVGMQLGVLSRHFGLISSELPVTVCDVLGTSGDLAVADRIAFLAALERRGCVLVLESDGWYHAVTIDEAIEAGQISAMRPPSDGRPVPRIMSIVSERGITPALGPLACA
jgi:hypothetical protein